MIYLCFDFLKFQNSNKNFLYSQKVLLDLVNFFSDLKIRSSEVWNNFFPNLWHHTGILNLSLSLKAYCLFEVFQLCIYIRQRENLFFQKLRKFDTYQDFPILIFQVLFISISSCSFNLIKVQPFPNGENVALHRPQYLSSL